MAIFGNKDAEQKGKQDAPAQQAASVNPLDQNPAGVEERPPEAPKQAHQQVEEKLSEKQEVSEDKLIVWARKKGLLLKPEDVVNSESLDRLAVKIHSKVNGYKVRAVRHILKVHYGA